MNVSGRWRFSLWLLINQSPVQWEFVETDELSCMWAADVDGIKPSITLFRMWLFSNKRFRTLGSCVDLDTSRDAVNNKVVDSHCEDFNASSSGVTGSQNGHIWSCANLSHQSLNQVKFSHVFYSGTDFCGRNCGVREPITRARWRLLPEGDQSSISPVTPETRGEEVFPLLMTSSILYVRLLHPPSLEILKRVKSQSNTGPKEKRNKKEGKESEDAQRAGTVKKKRVISLHPPLTEILISCWWITVRRDKGHWSLNSNSAYGSSPLVSCCVFIFIICVFSFISCSAKTNHFGGEQHRWAERSGNDHEHPPSHFDSWHQIPLEADREQHVHLRPVRQSNESRWKFRWSSSM